MVNISSYRLLDKTIVFFLLFLTYIFRFLLIKKKGIRKKVLIVRLWALGDCVNTLPLMKALDKKGYKVHLLTTKNVSFVFNEQEFIKKKHFFNFNKPFSIFSFVKQLRKEKYDIIIDTEQFMNMSTLFSTLIGAPKRIGYDHLFRSNLYTDKVKYVEMHHFVTNFMRLLHPLNIKSNPKKLIPLKYSKEAKIKVDKLLKKYKSKTTMAIHMGSGGTALGRRWPTKRFASLCKKISKNHKKIVFFFTGTGDEINLYNEIKSQLKGIKHEVLINELSLNEFIYFLSQIDFYVGNDTGPMHISAAMGATNIGIFGMNHPDKCGAYPLNKNINIYKNPNNNPIINNKYSKYPSDKYSTIKLVKVDDVYKEIEKRLKK